MNIGSINIKVISMIFEKMDSDTIYEVLISTRGADGNLNIKPFGMSLHEGNVVLKLYPNNTLFNIKKKGSFDLLFTYDVLMYTKSILGLLSEDSLESVDCRVSCKVMDFVVDKVEDTYGKNITTTIIAKPVNIIKNDLTMPLISRAKNKIIELLVDYSRYEYMDVDAQEKFIKKLEKTSDFIQKNGNKKHKQSINLLKKEIRKY